MSTAELPMTTALELPDRRVSANLGVCYGLVVRSMGFTGGVAASFNVAPLEPAADVSAGTTMQRWPRWRRGHGESDASAPGWTPTGERFRDPKTGKVMRVRVDGAGGRHYYVVDDAS
jgi:hypothetical protein